MTLWATLLYHQFKGVIADNPLLCLRKNFIMTASNCSGHPAISFQPSPPCQQKRFHSVIGFVPVDFSPSVCDCASVHVCYLDADTVAAVGSTKMQRVSFCVCCGWIVLLFSARLSRSVCGAVCPMEDTDTSHNQQSRAQCEFLKYCCF